MPGIAVRPCCRGLFIAVSALAMAWVRREAVLNLTGPTPNLEADVASIQSEIFSQSAFGWPPRCTGRAHSGVERNLI